MVGTDDLRQLLTATTAAGIKTVLVGDHISWPRSKPAAACSPNSAPICPGHNTSPRCGACATPKSAPRRWRCATAGRLRCAAPSSWYRSHDRLHCGDPITMAADALAAYQADTAAGKDALLVCDTTEMADALNQRIHHDTVDTDAPTVTGARGHRIGVGDLILSRRNDPTIDLRNTTDHRRPSWTRCATATDGASPQSTRPTNRIAAERLDDGARAVFDGDYLREHISLGYAVTVHSAQGVTADTTHAVLGENTTRAMLYVAMTRGRAHQHRLPLRTHHRRQRIRPPRTRRHPPRVSRSGYGLPLVPWRHRLKEVVAMETRRKFRSRSSGRVRCGSSGRREADRAGGQGARHQRGHPGELDHPGSAGP